MVSVDRGDHAQVTIEVTNRIAPAARTLENERIGGAEIVRSVPDYGLRVAARCECPPKAPLVTPSGAAPAADLLLDSNCVTAA
jgi:hypothetical protein